MKLTTTMGYLPLLILLLLTSCNVETFVKKGDQYYALGEYYDAAAEYKTAYSRTPTKDRIKRAERALKMADCYRRINHTTKALGAYQNALRYNVKDSLAIFHLAEMQRKNGDYKAATKSYERFLALSPSHTLALQGIQGATLAQEWRTRPTRCKIKRQDIFNSRRAEYSPVLSGDNHDVLYFSSTRPQATGDEISAITGMKNGDLFVTRKDDKGKWSIPEPIDSDVNTSDDEGALCLTPDEKTMYFTRCSSDPNYPRYAQLFESGRADASWRKPQLLTISKDTLSSYAHPAISPDGSWLYFVSDMPGGFGGTDLWRVRLTTNGLGGVENLGSSVNTEGNEMFPTFRPNGELYFSSDGHAGMGGLDIFKAIVDSTGNKWIVENLQFPVNSQADDFGMTFEGAYNRGYFSSNRGDARGWDHIYSFEYPEVLQTVKGWVYEKDGYELPSAQVYMVGDDGTNLKLSVRGDGSFVQPINPHTNYILLGTCKGFLNHKQELRVDTVSESQEYVLQFPLASITAPVLVNNVFYEFDKADLTPESTNALDALYELLQENPNVTIELSSHCDYRGNDTYNLHLSHRRAESVVKYLIAKGMDSKRLTPVGYGESRPKIINRKLTETYKFLQENDTLTEAFITKLSDEEQELCNALNRRTEFRVLRTTYGLMDQLHTSSSASAIKEEE